MYIDGGCINNFPINIFDVNDLDKIIGINLIKDTNN